MASSSAPRRGRASVDVGSKAEVLPAGSATTHTSPFRVDSQQAPAAAECSPPHRPTGHPRRGGDCRWRARVWLASLDVLGRYERRAGDDEAERDEAAPIFAWAGADGFAEDDGADLTGNLVGEHGDMPWRSGGSGARMLVDQIATLGLSGRTAHLTIERTRPGDWATPPLHQTLSQTIALVEKERSRTRRRPLGGEDSAGTAASGMDRDRAVREDGARRSMRLVLSGANERHDTGAPAGRSGASEAALRGGRPRPPRRRHASAGADHAPSPGSRGP
jgi:hypothetical protein